MRPFTRPAAGHSHDWRKVVATRHEEDPLSGLAVTQALRRCPCGEVDVAVLPGLWSLDQVRGLAGDDVR